MRYLNKIVFINSASVKYAEIGLDGNVHLIGTQGVGKSTLLRAILFFYNANKSKLGIPREKKRFDDYYFEYQNSYIVYEIVKDEVPFCVLAYKVNGKVAFRFFDAAYQKAFFIDENGRAFENWDKVRNALGKGVHYTKIISSYEVFRKIIYGDNKGLQSAFKKYALVESKQYQNIPRTIQNVLLNSNLEAKFIKDTIINSINEEEFSIDVSNYSKNHLKDFETQINDIRIWFKVNKKGQIIIRKQADAIIDHHRIFNFLKREKKELAIELAGRMDYIARESPLLSSRFSVEQKALGISFQKKKNLKALHLKRAQKIISNIDYLKKKLAEARTKQAEYSNQNIEILIEKVAQKEVLQKEKTAKTKEKDLLTAQFAEINQKYDALIIQIRNQQSTFLNEKNAEINQVEHTFSDEKNAITEKNNQLAAKIESIHKEQEEKAVNEIEIIYNKENSFKRDRATLKYRTFFTTEIQNCKAVAQALDRKIKASESLILNATNEAKILRKEWELEEKEISRNADSEMEKEQVLQQNYVEQMEEMEAKIKQSDTSFYGWLNDHKPDWQKTIGKVIDEKNALFNSGLNPKLTGDNTASFFGININLNALDNRIKSVQEYKAEVVVLKNKIAEIQKTIQKKNEAKNNSLKKNKLKFRKKLSSHKDAISENKYIISQSEQGLKKNKIALDEWIVKASAAKETAVQNIEKELALLSIQKEKAKADVERIKRDLSREINKIRKEAATEINKIRQVKNDNIETIITAISVAEMDANKRIEELKSQQNEALGNEGVDTKRLNTIEDRLAEISADLLYIKGNERTVFDYEKDKRELFDKVPEFKTEKTALENKQLILDKEQSLEQEKFDEKHKLQERIVEDIKAKMKVFDDDLEKFKEFSKSDTFLSIQTFFTTPLEESNHHKTAIAIISEINDKYYKSIGRFNELQKSVNSFIGHFNEDNIFSFKVKLNEDSDYFNFAIELKEFIEEDKIDQYEKRVNERFAHIIHQIGHETTELISKEAEIEKIIKKINNDFMSKNFVGAIKSMEMRTQKSTNKVVRILIQIKEFNDENNLILGKTNLFTSQDSGSKNQKAVELLKQLVRELERYKNATLSLTESFDLQFRIIENDNDSGWVEKLANVGSEGTDVLVKAMINILLLNVFKNSASKQFNSFKLHCMMDEIGRLHPNNVRGILRFANDRNILLINGSPISNNATDYRYTYLLSKVQSKTNSKKYITKIRRLVKKNG